MLLAVQSSAIQFGLLVVSFPGSLLPLGRKQQPDSSPCWPVKHADNRKVSTTPSVTGALAGFPLVKFCGRSRWRLFAMSITGVKVGDGHQDHGHHGEARRDPKTMFKLVTPPGDPAEAAQEHEECDLKEHVEPGAGHETGCPSRKNSGDVQKNPTSNPQTFREFQFKGHQKSISGEGLEGGGSQGRGRPRGGRLPRLVASRVLLHEMRFQANGDRRGGASICGETKDFRGGPVGW